MGKIPVYSQVVQRRQRMHLAYRSQLDRHTFIQETVNAVLLGCIAVVLIGLGLSLAGNSRPVYAADRAIDSQQFIPAPITEPAKGVFLVATQTMPDPRFQRSVILLVQHDETGTLGLIVNRPSDLLLADVLPDFENAAKQTEPLFFGGPVAPGIILFLVSGQKLAEDLTPILGERLYFGGDRIVLQKLLAPEKPSERLQLRLYFGHAGWAPGQLETEIAGGGWRLFRGDPAVVFHESPATVWELFLTQPGFMVFRDQSMASNPLFTP